METNICSDSGSWQQQKKSTRKKRLNLWTTKKGLTLMSRIGNFSVDEEKDLGWIEVKEVWNYEVWGSLISDVEHLGEGGS